MPLPDDQFNQLLGRFFLDASSIPNFNKSIRNIARIAGKEPHASPAIEWLSTINRRWLLLFASADDATLDVESCTNYFPRGKDGHILITARNQFASILGSRTTSLPQPWEPELRTSAVNIIEAIDRLKQTED
ncbi:hypothetical protein F5Y08DRAFT_341973 [Xylaria arbuscula]|nr:hypothetical protein F5Y08DRAFT_341973 [Xylaria arbuscula]